MIGATMKCHLRGPSGEDYQKGAEGWKTPFQNHDLLQIRTAN
jgi:hypothetical protein